MRTASIIFGRFQPPTKAHIALLKYFREITEYNRFSNYVFLSNSVDHKKNPLSLDFRIKYLSKILPLHYVGSKNPFYAICELGKMGMYDNINLYCGSDRVKRYQEFSKYINHSDESKRIPFIQKINVISFGKRDQYSNNFIETVSGTKARQYAICGKYIHFMKLVPGNLADRLKLYKTTRAGLL